MVHRSMEARYDVAITDPLTRSTPHTRHGSAERFTFLASSGEHRSIVLKSRSEDFDDARLLRDYRVGPWRATFLFIKGALVAGRLYQL